MSLRKRQRLSDADDVVLDVKRKELKQLKNTVIVT